MDREGIPDFDNLLSETRREIEALPDVDIVHKSLLLGILNEKETFRPKTRQRVHSSPEIVSDDSYLSKSVIEPRVQEEIRALENGMEDLPKYMEPEDECHQSKKQEDLHEATERGNHRLKRRYMRREKKKGLSVREEKEISDTPVNPNYRKKLRSYTSAPFPHVENLSQHDEDSVSVKREENTRLLQRKNIVKGKKRDRHVLGRGGGDKLDCKEKHREIQSGVGYDAPGPKRYLRTRVKQEEDERPLHGMNNRKRRHKEPESSEKIKKLCSRKTYKKAKGQVVDVCVTVKLEREDEDGYDGDDVEILDKTAFYRMIDEKPVTVASESTLVELSFRQQVISLLRKPYEKKEHDELWAAVTHHKAKEVFRDLCNGRERFCKTNEEGKSYLDYHPDFNRKLELHSHNEPRCLNLLRGFFFWLQNNSQRWSFRPWRDLECLKTYPDYC